MRREYTIEEEEEVLELVVNGVTTYKKTHAKFVIYCHPPTRRFWGGWPKKYRLSDKTDVRSGYDTLSEATTALASYISRTFPLDADVPRT